MKVLLDLFYPKVCLGCSKIIGQNEELLCLKCRHEWPMTNHHTIDDNEFVKRFFGRLPIEQAASMAYYHKKGIVQEVIHHLKYKNQPEIGTLLGKWYGTILLKDKVFNEVSCVVPVPIHPQKLRERGYNQVENFAKALAEKLQKPFVPDVLIRSKYSKTQVFKNLSERTDVIDNSFNLNPKIHPTNHHFLLVDDLITTGSTIESCGKSLLSIENSKLSLATIGFAH